MRVAGVVERLPAHERVAFVGRPRDAAASVRHVIHARASTWAGFKALLETQPRNGRSGVCGLFNQRAALQRARGQARRLCSRSRAVGMGGAGRRALEVLAEEQRLAKWQASSLSCNTTRL